MTPARYEYVRDQIARILNDMEGLALKPSYVARQGRRLRRLVNELIDEPLPVIPLPDD